MQEAYITSETALLWKGEWEGDFYYQPGTSNSGGLIILISKFFCCENKAEIKINNRILGISFVLNQKQFIIYNIYAPASKEQRVGFLEQLPNLINPISSNDFVIFCGDFNNLIDNNLDNINGADHSTNEVLSFNNFVSKYELTDTWRNLHPYSKEYSWIRIF